MYEVATFCSLRPLGTLHFVPVASVPPVLALWLFHTLAMIGIGYVAPVTVFSPTTAALLIAHCGPVTRVLVLYVLVFIVPRIDRRLDRDLFDGDGEVAHAGVGDGLRGATHSARAH